MLLHIIELFIEGHTGYDRAEIASSAARSMIEAGVLVKKRCVGHPRCGPMKPRGHPPNVGLPANGTGPRDRRTKDLRLDYAKRWEEYQQHHASEHYVLDEDKLAVWVVSHVLIDEDE